MEYISLIFLCLFVCFFSFILFLIFFVFVANIQDALLFKKGKTRTYFCGVFSVISFNFIIVVNLFKLVKMCTYAYIGKKTKKLLLKPIFNKNCSIFSLIFPLYIYIYSFKCNFPIISLYIAYPEGKFVSLKYPHTYNF